MKKYRLKIDSPWGKKGDVKLTDDDGYLYHAVRINDYSPTPCIIKFSPERYEDLFEKVIEPTDEEFLRHWLFKNDISDKESYDSYLVLAKALIQHGFDVKKLRGES